MYARNIPNRTAALTNYFSPDPAQRANMTKREYRDFIISLYQGEIENRYRSFTDQLNSGSRGTGLGFDLVLLGLNGAAALVSPNSVDEIATVTAVTSGARATIDKRLYYEQTLPALIKAMDAQRAQIMTEIVRKQQLPAEQYGLDLAFNDLNRLIDAGRISAAVTRVTTLSDADAAAQQQRLNAITAACDEISIDAASLNREFRELIMTTDGSRDGNLVAAATQLGLPVPNGTVPSWLSVASAFDAKLCDDTKKRRFIDDLKNTLQAGGH